MSPQILTFAATFALACLVSALAYALARRSAPFMRWVRIGLCFVLLCNLLLFAVTLGAQSDVGTIGLFVALTLGASGLQTLLERPLEVPTLTTKTLFLRALLTYLCTASILCFLVALLAAKVAVAVTGAGASAVPLWLLQLSLERYGHIAGWFLAPLSISFCRLLVHNTHLRPGIDRPLRDDELVG